MNQNTIVIVGNGPSVLNREMGRQIDNFDTVVRINNFVTEGYEKYVGSRTDIWTRSGSDMIKERDTSSFDSVLWLVALPAWERRRDKIDEIRRKIKRSVRNSGEEILVNKTEIKRITEKYFREGKEVRPTTGLYTVFYFLERFPKLAIYGFDFFNNHKIKMWYFDNATKSKMNGHDIVLEKRIMEEFVSCGKVVVL